MGFLKIFFNEIIFRPIFNLMVILYYIIPDLGVVIIILTIFIRLLLLPIARKSIESQKKLQEIQPAIEEIKRKYKNDRQVQGVKIMELYKKHQINPASGCLPLLIQLIFLIALYKVFITGISGFNKMNLSYHFIKDPGNLNQIAFGFLDLSKVNAPLALLAAILQFYQGKMMLKNSPQNKKRETKEEPDFSTIMQQQMVYVSPFVTLIIGLKFSSGLVIYWIVTTIFTIIQQYFVIKKDENKLPKN